MFAWLTKRNEKLVRPNSFFIIFFKSFFHCIRLSESECKLNFIVLFWCYFLSHLVLIKYILAWLGRTMKEYMISVCARLPFSLSLPKFKWIVFIAINNCDLFMILSSFPVPRFRKRTIFKLNKTRNARYSSEVQTARDFLIIVEFHLSKLSFIYTFEHWSCNLSPLNTGSKHWHLGLNAFNYYYCWIENSWIRKIAMLCENETWMFVKNVSAEKISGQSKLIERIWNNLVVEIGRSYGFGWNNNTKCHSSQCVHSFGMN